MSIRSFRACEEEVEAQVRARAPLATVETAIEDSGLDPDQQAALWLVGWSLIDLGADHPQVERPPSIG